MRKRNFRKEKYIKNRLSERTGLFTFQVFIDYTDDDFQKQRYTKSFAEKDYNTTKEAMEAACKHRDSVLNKLSTIGILKPDKLTINECFDLVEQVFPARYNTKRKRIITYNKYIRKDFGNSYIDSLLAFDVQSSFASLVSVCSDDTLSRIFTVWNFIFKTARLRKCVQSNIMEEVIIPKSLRITKKRGTYTDYKTVKLVIDDLLSPRYRNDNNMFNSTIIAYALELLYETGIRPAECFALKKSDIDFNNRLIFIEDYIGSDENEKNVIRTPKTPESKRHVPFSTQFMPLLKEMYSFQDSERLFARFDGEIFKMETVEDRIRRTCRRLGIEFNMYRCRHKLSTDLVTSNTDPKTVMEILGHTSFNTTQGYTHSNDELKKKAIDDRKRH